MVVLEKRGCGVEGMKRRKKGGEGVGEDEEGGGGGHLFLRLCGGYEAASPGAWSQGLFDVEIGQFESVSFNFSQLTGPPWVLHTFLIGYKLVFLSSHYLSF